MNEKNTSRSMGEISVKEMECLAKSVRMIVNSFSESSGADCVIYSILGADVLNKMGFNAKAVAGSANWRVGAGDGDVINHAGEIMNQAFAPIGGNLAMMFHAWIQISYDGEEKKEIVDFSSWQFSKKAKALEEMDGVKTSVEFNPDFLWIREDSKEMLKTAQEVVNSFDIGVYYYKRRENLENVVLSKNAIDNYASLADPALYVYNALMADEKIEVFGVGEKEITDPMEEKPLKLRRVMP